MAAGTESEPFFFDELLALVVDPVAFFDEDEDEDVDA